MQLKISNELKIGIATIVALVVLVVGIQYLKGVNMLRQGRYYYVACDDVSGLAVSGHVMLNGYQVGLVRDMHYDYATTGKVIVLINVEDGLQLAADSRAEVASDLLGTASIVLHQGTDERRLASYDTIPGGGRAAGLMDAAAPVVGGVEALLPRLDTLIAGLNVLVADSKLHESLLEVNRLTGQLNASAGQLNRLLRSDVPRLLADADSAAASIGDIAADVKEADVARTLAEATRALEQANRLLADAQSPNSTVGRLTTTTELHDRLTATLAGVDSLVGDIRQNPKRYINFKLFGK